MGCAPSTTKLQYSELTVATLNYSGILLSPYEFYEKEDQEEKAINQQMKDLLSHEQERKGKLYFDFGPFQKQWQKQRYSPLYNPICGIKNGIYLMDSNEFQKVWERVLEESKKYIDHVYQEYKTKKLDNIKPKQYYLENLKKLDLLIYKTILYQLYNQDKERAELENNFHEIDKLQLNAKKYRDHRKAKFKKAFLNEEEKIKKTIQAIEELKLDIFFVQQVSQPFVDALERTLNQFRIVKSCFPESTKISCDSIIVIRQQKFPKVKSLVQQNSRFIQNVNPLQGPYQSPCKLEEQQLLDLNINNSTVVQFIYNLILICPHLSSDEINNRNQMNQLEKAIRFLMEKFPDCHLILGGDLNNKSFKAFSYDSHGDKKEFNVVPDYDKYFTAYKKRTALQAQPTKANKVNCQTKDYILTDLPIKQVKVITIDGKQIMDRKTLEDIKKKRSEKLIPQDESEDYQLPFLPTDAHPYDHFMVLTKIFLTPNQLEHITDENYIYKYSPHKLTQNAFEGINESKLNQKKKENKISEQKMPENLPQ